jgi:uncharacterized protein DUF4262
MARLADEYGWAVQGVERERTRPPWACTVGLTPRDRPELLITGLPLRRCTELLTAMAAGPCSAHVRVRDHGQVHPCRSDG